MVLYAEMDEKYDQNSFRSTIIEEEIIYLSGGTNGKIYHGD
jgi:hypothetical protein